MSDIANLLTEQMRIVCDARMGPYANSETFRSGAAAETAMEFVSDLDSVAFIICSSQSHRLTFCVMYNAQKAVPLIEFLYKDQANEQLVGDFMKEFCNLAGGTFNGVLINQDISSHLSLPVLTNPLDDVLFLDSEATVFKQAFWELSDGKHRVICNSQLEIFDEGRFAGFKLAEDITSQDDDEPELF